MVVLGWMSVLVRGKPLQVERGSLGSPKARPSLVGGAGEGAGILGDLHAGVCTPIAGQDRGSSRFLNVGERALNWGLLGSPGGLCRGHVAHG